VFLEGEENGRYDGRDQSNLEMRVGRSSQRRGNKGEKGDSLEKRGRPFFLGSCAGEGGEGLKVRRKEKAGGEGQYCKRRSENRGKEQHELLRARSDLG